MESRIRNRLVGMIDRTLGEDPKEALIAARELKDEVDWLTERAVAMARLGGYDWGRIGRLLGISRQWARDRFKNAPPRLPPHLVARNRYLAEQRKTERMFNELRSNRGGPQGDDAVPW